MKKKKNLPLLWLDRELREYELHRIVTMDCVSRRAATTVQRRWKSTAQLPFTLASSTKNNNHCFQLRSVCFYYRLQILECRLSGPGDHSIRRTSYRPRALQRQLSGKTMMMMMMMIPKSKTSSTRIILIINILRRFRHQVLLQPPSDMNRRKRRE